MIGENMTNEKISDIDLEMSIEFLKENRGKKYIKPEKSEDRYDEMLELKESGSKARKNFDRFGDLLQKKLNDLGKEYKKQTCNGWIDQGQNITSYFWIQIKKAEYTNLSHSISVSLDNGSSINDDYILNISVECKDFNSEDKDFYYHNKIINLDVDSKDIKFEVELNDGSYVYIDNKEKVKERLDKGEIKKIKYRINIEKPYNKAENSRLIEDSLKAFNTLERYYNYILENRNYNNLSNDNFENIPSLKKKDTNNIEDISLNTILFGPPGTGKTYYTKLYANAICDNLDIDAVNNMSYEDLSIRYNELLEENRVVFTTFHQSYGYEEFVEGIKPTVDSNNNISYEIKDGIFKKICIAAKNNPDKAHLLIIDEINRGNISKIFGELITLIEASKREGLEEEIYAELLYSNESFSVPQNLYILATMNTADRSISLMDTAIRRRFKFIEMMPDPKLLEDIDTNSELDNLNISKLLDVINKRISVLFDREHTIGHAYFMPLKENPKIEILASIFKENIIPLLQEYFYDDYEKIQLILGDRLSNVSEEESKYQFILSDEIDPTNIFRDTLDFDLNEKTYHINENAFYHIESYKKVYGDEQFFRS